MHHRIAAADPDLQGAWVAQISDEAISGDSLQIVQPTCLPRQQTETSSPVSKFSRHMTTNKARCAGKKNFHIEGRRHSAPEVARG
ncbi:hypothetical protein ACPOL_1269 [Acidisarcina polymorpha]|uniref:Uncharacterized protein n=1 Tax=Acidisarcina polymorpha TaxID=2211140 RepID=A0A2Z5FVT2_9BACT|nr:hypothetical protein ACPOL_1269 [Acidisarcina polymorpha]